MSRRALLTGFAILLSGISLFADDSRHGTLTFPPFGHCYGLRKGTARNLWMFLGDRTRFDNPQGLAAVKLNEQDRKGPKDDDELTVYGVNAGRHQIIYNKSLLALEIYGKRGDGDGEFKSPKGICANVAGDVFVADTGNHRIVHLQNTDNKLTYVKSIGHEGSEVNDLRYPSQVYWTEEGRLYITDTGNNRIQVFGADGHYERTYPDRAEGSALTFLEPDGIAVTTPKADWSKHHSAFFCVVDSAHARLRKFSLDGDLLAVASLPDLPFERFFLAYLALDYYENIWVTDTANHTLHKFDRDLNYITSVGTKGHGDFEFDAPRGITIWRRFGQVFVAEKESAQYYWIGVDIQRATARAEDGVLKMSYYLTEPARITAQIQAGETTIQDLVMDSQQNTGDHILNYEIPNLAAGSYQLYLKAVPTYSSRKYFKKELLIPFAIQ